MHCHDLLAFEAALGLQPFHHLCRSGRIYQRWIQRGFHRARCFLSVSAANQASLEPHPHLTRKPLLSAVVHNPHSPRFVPLPKEQVACALKEALPQIGQEPFLLHTGDNWYKNRLGVLAIWEQLHRLGHPQHLVLVGAADAEMHTCLHQHPHLAPWLHVLDWASDDLVVALYNRAVLLLYPSHAEGFGRPVLEALACGCPVLTTDRAPMTEISGDAADYIHPAPAPPESLERWAQQAALRLQAVLARNFHLSTWLEQLEAHYQRARALQMRK